MARFDGFDRAHVSRSFVTTGGFVGVGCGWSGRGSGTTAASTVASSPSGVISWNGGLGVLVESHHVNEALRAAEIAPAILDAMRLASAMGDPSSPEHREAETVPAAISTLQESVARLAETLRRAAAIVGGGAEPQPPSATAPGRR